MGHAAPGEALLRLFEDAEDARVLMDTDGLVVLVNASFEETFGWSRSDVVGNSKRLLVPEHLQDEYSRLRVLLVATDSHDAVRMNLRALHQDGTEIPVLLTARLIHLGEDRLVSLILQPRPDADPDTGFRELLDALLDGNVIVDGDGRIVMANDQVEALFGYREEELVDRPVEVLVPEAARATHDSLRHGFTGRARRHAMGRGNRVLGRRKDGSTFPIQVLLSSIGTDENVLVSATIRDLSGVEELMSRNDELRGQFLATVSHELRTPLTTIMASSEMLVDVLATLDDLDTRGQVAAYADRIMRAARRELTLIDDLLALTSIEASEAHVGSGLADLGVVARGAVAHLRERAEAAGLVLDVVGTDEALLVSVQEGWLARAVGCLVDNAVKFTPPGGQVTVLLRGGADAELEVRDTGPGVPEGEQEEVFERLHRGRNAVAAETPGAGLGLTIARSIIRAAGGDVEAVAAEHGGCFRLRLPLAEVAR
ncbi:PAS domain S-box protein [Nocardioides sp. MAH-18]|uniref:histidine kinase n=1 Tax=Nocardioides agri TaxID=2682843 RepID=A0A6L6XKV2_9ACTN|nr:MULTISPECIES: PAS domain-containing sensor histidine kinase [unclassified Nocardioides]MBA2956596.1 PAS domain-containing sensor histidine kinase [Nocardioides sp. CGMCC 1.13656]MVQ47740.1 PAS domain S-box protein [Nocardioides sp. MAH-18]